MRGKRRKKDVDSRHPVGSFVDFRSRINRDIHRPKTFPDFRFYSICKFLWWWILFFMIGNIHLAFGYIWFFSARDFTLVSWMSNLASQREQRKNTNSGDSAPPPLRNHRPKLPGCESYDIRRLSRWLHFVIPFYFFVYCEGYSLSFFCRRYRQVRDSLVQQMVRDRESKQVSRRAWGSSPGVSSAGYLEKTCIVKVADSRASSSTLHQLHCFELSALRRFDNLPLHVSQLPFSLSTLAVVKLGN